MFSYHAHHLGEGYLGIMRFTLPIGKISIDFPQNLFFHLTSGKKNILSKIIPNNIYVYSVQFPLVIKKANWVLLADLH